MDAELKEFLQSILDLSFDEKVQLGKDSLAEFVQGIKDYGVSDEETVALIVGFTRLFVSADLSCTREEYCFFRAVTGMEISTDEFFDMTNNGRDGDFLDSAGELLNSLTYEQKRAIVIYGIALLSCDNVIKVDEIKMVEAILGR